MAGPFLKQVPHWHGVIRGILSLDASKDKREQLDYAKAILRNPQWDQILSIPNVWSTIANSNDVEMAEAIIPWKTVQNTDKDKLLHLALKRATNTRHPNDAMLFYIYKWYNFFSTVFCCSTFEVKKSLQHPLAKSILQSSRIKIDRGIPPSASCLEFLLEHEHLEEKNVLIAKWTSHPALRSETFMQIWNKHEYPLMEILIRKRKRFLFNGI